MIYYNTIQEGIILPTSNVKVSISNIDGAYDMGVNLHLEGGWLPAMYLMVAKLHIKYLLILLSMQLPFIYTQCIKVILQLCYMEQPWAAV